MQLYEFVYSDCVYENSFTISTHFTKKGAWNAMRKHKLDKYDSWVKGRSFFKLDKGEKFGEMENWSIKEIEVQP